MGHLEHNHEYMHEGLHKHTHSHSVMELNSTEEAIKYLAYTISHNESHHKDLDGLAGYLDKAGYEEEHLLLHKAAEYMYECNQAVHEALESLQAKQSKEQ